MRQNRISVNDIKYDLIKIIEPYDGRLENKEPAGAIVSEIFQSYLKDLQKQRKVQDFEIFTTKRDTAFTYDISVKLDVERSPKKLKIHVGIFQYPWTEKKEAA